MKKRSLATIMAAITMAAPAQAQDHSHHQHHNHATMAIGSTNHHDHGIQSHAPISVMGDHMHNKGDWMISYRFMRMEMEGNRNGTDDLSVADISGDIPNRFFGSPMQPSTLRIVPTDMTMDMHMLGAMYAPQNWLTLMVMTNYLDKKMDHITFAAANPNLELGRFRTESSGWGDTKLTGLIRLLQNQKHHIHLHAGVGLPTGSLDEEGTILNPMNNPARIRLPYAMQLGSGTYDLLPGLTYTGTSGDYGWGAQYKAELRLGENHEDYTFGDKHNLNLWVGKSWNEAFSTSLRLGLEYESKIDGIDSQIIGPVQTADPDNYGGKRANIGVGFKYTLPFQSKQAHDINAEITLPIYQNLNGPQMKRDYGFTIGYRMAF